MLVSEAGDAFAVSLESSLPMHPAASDPPLSALKPAFPAPKVRSIPAWGVARQRASPARSHDGAALLELLVTHGYFPVTDPSRKEVRTDAD